MMEFLASQPDSFYAGLAVGLMVGLISGLIAKMADH